MVVFTERVFDSLYCLEDALVSYRLCLYIWLGFCWLPETNDTRTRRELPWNNARMEALITGLGQAPKFFGVQQPLLTQRLA